MLKFLGNIVEQLDLALEHLSKGDANNARFGLMLTDNAVEIALHQFAKDHKALRDSEGWMRNKYKDAALLQRALGRHFEDKVKLAKSLGKLSNDTAESIVIFHGVRNEVYHIGLQHEAVLPALAAFYFEVACGFLGSYQPLYYSWSSGQTYPDRSLKYLSRPDMLTVGGEQYKVACQKLAAQAGFDPAGLIEALADHIDELIEDQDSSIDLISTGAPQKRARDQVIIDCQAWAMTFSDEGAKFLAESGCPDVKIFGRVQWITDHYPFAVKRDPISAWRKRAKSVRHEKEPHAALWKYYAFMGQTATLRDLITDAGYQVEAYIDQEIDRLRGR